MCGPVRGWRGVRGPGLPVWVLALAGWVGDRGHRAARLNPDGSKAGIFVVGNSPDAIASDGTNMWIANGGSNNVME